MTITITDAMKDDFIRHYNYLVDELKDAKAKYRKSVEEHNPDHYAYYRDMRDIKKQILTFELAINYFELVVMVDDNEKAINIITTDERSKM